MIQMISDNSSNRLTLGERLCSVRQEAGLTQRDLADRTGLTQSQICRIEMGGRLQQPSLAMLKLLAEGAQTALTELVRGTPLERLLVDEPLDEDSGPHVHYCPNPRCSRNRICPEVRDAFPSDTYSIAYDSFERISRQEFLQVEFCGCCGTPLVKACPHCGKRIRKAPEYFCCRCGKQIDEGPNEAERKRLKEVFGVCRQSFPPLMEKGPRARLCGQHQPKANAKGQNSPPPAADKGAGQKAADTAGGGNGHSSAVGKTPPPGLAEATPGKPDRQTAPATKGQGQHPNPHPADARPPTPPREAVQARLAEGPEVAKGRVPATGANKTP